MGATLGGAFGAFAQTVFPWLNLSIPAFAIVGMAAMVGGGTGAAMTAVTMIFEMTRLGVITKEHVADSVALSVRPYTSIEGKP
jgi:chloride channel protein, CIC family